MLNRHAIIGSDTRLFGSLNFDAIPTLEIADEANVKMPLNYHHIKKKLEIFKIGLGLAFNEYISPFIIEITEQISQVGKIEHNL